MEKFPGRGAFYFILGSFLVTLFLPLPIALASILILALGDSFTNIIGRYFGKIHLPYNPKKTIEGPLFGFVLAGIGGSFFVSPLASFVASFVAMAVETLPLRIGSFEIDDNLTIPVVAGVVMWMMVG
jgi:dolichol kinase